ncbi:MAG TPA: hypothetical protein VG500_14460 [Gemmatimonadales bacterium]|jgi:hypothetical protein|nr:hypothetical protein [Gemmatimonadales bacterium]
MPGLFRHRCRLFNALSTERLDRGVLVTAIELLERDPLASAGEFPGDLLRRLIDLPPRVWAAEADLYSRYREVVRAAAAARRSLPEEARGTFWRALPSQLAEE